MPKPHAMRRSKSRRARSDEDAADAELAAAYELARRTQDWADLNHEQIVNFILSQGLAHDIAEAAQKITRWEITGLLGAEFAAKVASGAQKPARASLDQVRQRIADRWPGMHQLDAQESAPDAPINPGDSIAIACNGRWMSSSSALSEISAAAAATAAGPPVAPAPLSAPRSQTRKGQQEPSEAPSPISSVLVDGHPDMGSAFHVVSSEKPGLTCRHDSETVEYGDLVFLQTPTGQTLPVVFICPGRTGPVRRGHHVFMIHLSVRGRMRPWATSGTAGHLHLVDDPFELDSAPACFTLRSPRDYTGPGLADQQQTGRKRKAHESDVPVPFDLVSHNVWLEPRMSSSWQSVAKRISPRKKTRARAIPAALRRAMRASAQSGDGQYADDADVSTPDAAVITGAFCASASSVLQARFKRDLAMPFESPVLASAGLFVASRYPIEHTATLRFDAPHKERASAHSTPRAAVYVRIRKQQSCVHIFAANVQPGFSTATMRARESQFCTLRQWIQSLRLPRDEVVLIAGDLRTCRAMQPDAYERMLDILGSQDAAEIPPPLLASLRTCCEDINAMLASTQSFAARWSSRSRASNASSSSSTSLGTWTESAASPPRASTVRSLMDPAFRQILTVNPGSNALTMRLGRGPSLADTILVSRNHSAAKDPQFRVLGNAAAAEPYSLTSKAESTDLSTHYPLGLSFAL